MRPSPPSCGRRRLYAAIAAFMRLSPDSYGNRRFRAAITALVQPVQPPDPGGQKRTTDKEKNKEFSCIEVLDVSF
jgi:hypothetical protein